VVEVPLRLAVVEPEARRITTVAGRRIPVANQRDMAAAGQRRPRLLLGGGECRPGGGKKGESDEREPTEPALQRRHRSTTSGAGEPRGKGRRLAPASAGAPCWACGPAPERATPRA